MGGVVGRTVGVAGGVVVGAARVGVDETDGVTLGDGASVVGAVVGVAVGVGSTVCVAVARGRRV
jgi:hypothetical protein